MNFTGDGCGGRTRKGLQRFHISSQDGIIEGPPGHCDADLGPDLSQNLVEYIGPANLLRQSTLNHTIAMGTTGLQCKVAMDLMTVHFGILLAWAAESCGDFRMMSSRVESTRSATSVVGCCALCNTPELHTSINHFSSYNRNPMFPAFQHKVQRYCEMSAIFLQCIPL